MLSRSLFLILPYILAGCASGALINDGDLPSPTDDVEEEDTDLREDEKEEEDEKEKEKEEDEKEEEKDELDLDDWDDNRNCLREHQFNGWMDDNAGELSGMYKAGWHGQGYYNATIEAQDGWYEMVGGWSTENGDKSGELWGYLVEDNGEVYLFAYAYNDETVALIRSDFTRTGESFKGAGWWSFAQTQFEATATIESESGGTWEGQWIRRDTTSPAKGEWGYNDGSYETGWLNGEVELSEDRRPPLEGEWQTDDDTTSWRMQLGEWGILRGESYTISETQAELTGDGYPFTCR